MSLRAFYVRVVVAIRMFFWRRWPYVTRFIRWPWRFGGHEFGEGRVLDPITYSQIEFHCAKCPHMSRFMIDGGPRGRDANHYLWRLTRQEKKCEGRRRWALPGNPPRHDVESSKFSNETPPSLDPNLWHVDRRVKFTRLERWLGTDDEGGQIWEGTIVGFEEKPEPWRQGAIIVRPDGHKQRCAFVQFEVSPIGPPIKRVTWASHIEKIGSALDER